MELKIFRNSSNRLYTEGYLSINDMKTTHTVESTLTMLPEGKYEVKLKGCTQHRRQIAILLPAESGGPNVPYTVCHFEACGTWISSKKNKSIRIGEPIIPGALRLGSEVFERLFERIEMAEKRGESTTLEIVSRNLTNTLPIQYWTEPSHHGCPSSNRRVEKDGQGNVRVYDGDHLIREFPATEADLIEATVELNA